MHCPLLWLDPIENGMTSHPGPPSRQKLENKRITSNSNSCWCWESSASSVTVFNKSVQNADAKRYICISKLATAQICILCLQKNSFKKILSTSHKCTKAGWALTHLAENGALHSSVTTFRKSLQNAEQVQKVKATYPQANGLTTYRNDDAAPQPK